ncbi:MAG TPA: copper amine oxidase N-terminal domain-containing protein [Candidatus Rubrimentiphilum sp.]|nr:copper amine oxidase N-terminal domain-containing protein [Candidatus Rubrimentiphilum sp.]
MAAAAVMLLALLLGGSQAAAQTAPVAAAQIAQASPAPPPPAFGTPPSGEIPILYNDHTVYTKPDVLKQGRVLAALVKDGQIYVPLRSMFEQMGATITASADGKTVTATKSGATVSVTLDKPEVVINGETRPLDVPPIMYQGILLVPVRVISEGMGAYVLWVPTRRLVVVRYIPPTPPPTPEPTAAPTIAPVPTPVPTEAPYTMFVQAAVAQDQNYNEFVAGGYCKALLAAAAIVFKNSPFAVKVDYRLDSYVTSDNLTDGFGTHYTKFSTVDGGSALTPVFMARQSSLDGRLEYKIAEPKIYVGLGYLKTTTNYGYPSLNAIGFGLEKLPELRTGISWFGSAFYYPSASGTYTIVNAASPNNGKSYRQQYGITKLDIGLALALSHFPLYIYGGYSADQYTAKAAAPIGQTHNGPYLGLGLKI